MNLSAILANKHTSFAAAAYILAKGASEVGAVWFPEHKAQFDATTGIVESAAVGWGLLAAGDAKAIAAEPGGQRPPNVVSSPTTPATK